MAVDDPEDVVEQVTGVGAGETALAARLREGLAREARAKHVMFGDVLPGEPDVGSRPDPEVQVIQFPEVAVDLRREDAFVTESGQRHMKATKTGEQVDESETRITHVAYARARQNAAR